MDRVVAGYIGTWKFLWLILLIAIACIVYQYVIRRYLRRLVKQRGASGFDFGFIVFERLMVLMIVFVLIGLFILLKPGLGVILGLIAYGIAHKSLVDIIRGVQLISEMKLEVGQTVSIDGESGIIYKLGWTGIFTTSRNTVQFRTYSELAKLQIGYHEVNMPVVKYLFVQSSDSSLSLAKQKELLYSQLFAYPMLTDKQKPIVIPKDGGLEVRLGVSNSSYIQSFVNQLEQKEFDVTIIDQ